MYQNWSQINLIVISLLVFVGCYQHEKPRFQYMPHMHRSQVLKLNRASTFFADGASSRPSPEGTIPRNFTPYPFKGMPQTAAQGLKNPLRPTQEVLNLGKKMFETTCVVCHGPFGQGDGPIIGQNKFAQPPILTAENARKLADGEIYHIMTEGRGLMGSYAAILTSQERWSVVHYIRALQDSKR